MKSNIFVSSILTFSLLTTSSVFALDMVPEGGERFNNNVFVTTKSSGSKKSFPERAYDRISEGVFRILAAAKYGKTGAELDQHLNAMARSEADAELASIQAHIDLTQAHIDFDKRALLSTNDSSGRADLSIALGASPPPKKAVQRWKKSSKKSEVAPVDYSNYIAFLRASKVCSSKNPDGSYELNTSGCQSVRSSGLNGILKGIAMSLDMTTEEILETLDDKTAQDRLVDYIASLDEVKKSGMAANVWQSRYAEYAKEKYKDSRAPKK